MNNIELRNLIINICDELNIPRPKNGELKISIIERINESQNKFTLKSGDSIENIKEYLRLIS